MRMTAPFTVYVAGDLFNHKDLIGNALLVSYLEEVSGGWALCFPGGGLRESTSEPSFVERVVAEKLNKGLA